ncbi:MAG: hypothetical protein ACRBBP_02355 [Bdellovibrionales bacterium]
MKNLLLLFVVMGLFGCSSADKNMDQSQDSAEAVTDQAKAAIEEAAEDLKTAAEDLKTAANDKAAEATEAAPAATSDSSFEGYAGTESSKVTCTAGEDVRTVTVLNGDAGGCGVVYNKFGEDKTVAVAKNVMDYCSEVQAKIKGNLEAASFTCQ